MWVGVVVLCTNVLIHVDPISNHTSRVSLNCRCTDFSGRNMGGFSGKKKPTKRRKHYFFEMRKSAKSLWEFEVGRKHASVGPKKVVDAGQNQWLKRDSRHEKSWSGLESLLSERSNKGLLIFHLRKTPSLSIFKSSNLFQAAFQECLMDIHSEACNLTGAGHFHPKTRIRILQASKRKHRALACHIVNVHWLNNGWMDWHPSHNARGQLNEVHLKVLLFRETAQSFLIQEQNDKFESTIQSFLHWDFLVSSHIVSLRDEGHGAGSSQIALDDLHLVVFANELDIEGSWSHPAAWMTVTDDQLEAGWYVRW